MMKHRGILAGMCAVLALALLMCAPLALGEDRHGMNDQQWAEWLEEQKETPSRMVHFTEAWPQELAIEDELKAAGLDKALIVDGYASMRFGAWQYLEAVLQDDEGYILLGACYDRGESAWSVAGSRRALRQTELPVLLPEGVEYGYDDYNVGQSDGCDAFTLIYPNARYRWRAGFDGDTAFFMLGDITIGENRLDIAPKTISWMRPDGELVYAFNLMEIKLDRFDIAAFPTTFEEAAAVAADSDYADDSAAVTHIPKRLMENEAYWLIEPHIPLYELPDETSTICAMAFEQVQAEVLEQRDGFVRVRIASLTGWVKREFLLIGLERAAEWSWQGEYGQVYACGQSRTQPLYKAPSEKAAVITEPMADTMAYVQAVLPDGTWFIVRLPDDTCGWMRFDAVCQTSNYYDAWIYSEDGTKRLNLREGPGKEYQSIGKYYSGVHVVNLFSVKEHEGWSHVIIEGVSGWVDSSFLMGYADYNGREWLPPLKKISVKGGECPVYRAPDKGSELMDGRIDSTYAEIMGVSGTWAHARFRDGTSGYVELKYLGGEPKSADKNSFTLKKDIAQSDYLGNQTGDILKKGTKIRIAERPAGYWKGIWSEELGKTTDQAFVENPLIWVRILSAKKETGAYLKADDVSFWGK